MNHISNAERYTMMGMHIAIIMGVVYRIWRGEQSLRIARRTEKIVTNGKLPARAMEDRK